MSSRPISEKAVEILFNRFLLQAFPLGTLQLFAPSSAEEFRRGYDSKLVGAVAFRELYLQFKAPSYSKRRDLFTVQLTAHQHRLLKAYPPSSAFYVVPMFSSLLELNKAQADLRQAKDFLKHFTCIDVSGLPDEVDFLQYIQPDSHRSSPEVRYKVSADSTTHTARHSLSGRSWLRGTALVERFKSGEAGALVHLRAAAPTVDKDVLASPELNIWQPDLDGLALLARACSPRELGLLIRRVTV